MLLLNLYTGFIMFVASKCMLNSNSSTNSSSNSTDKKYPTMSKTVYHEPVWEPPIALPITKGVAAPHRPFYVKVHNLDKNVYCGGAVLKFPPPKLIVITAAHCISEYHMHRMFQNFGPCFQLHPQITTRRYEASIKNHSVDIVSE